ncbi:MAG: DUF362 domain-containing protein [Promethearchaeota archaeon]
MEYVAEAERSFPWREGPFLVSRVAADKDLRSAIDKAVGLVGGFSKFIEPGDTVTIKPNLNTADPYPASSDPLFIKALGEAILEAGAAKLKIMDSSTIRTSTRKVAEKIGLTPVAEELGAELFFLDEHPWVGQRFPRAEYMTSGDIGEPVLSCGKLVLAPCLKTHRLARFTGAMKLLIGLLKRSHRVRKMHLRKLQAKIADLASYFHPALVVMDAREVFVTGGPTNGQREAPGVILASDDMVAIDVEGVKILQGYEAKNKLKQPVWKMPQFRHAVKLRLGARSDDDIHLVEP